MHHISIVPPITAPFESHSRGPVVPIPVMVPPPDKVLKADKTSRVHVSTVTEPPASFRRPFAIFAPVIGSVPMVAKAYEMA